MRPALVGIVAIAVIGIGTPVAHGQDGGHEPPPANPGERLPAPEPPRAASAAFERSRHLLLDLRPFDFTAWKRELGIVHAEGPALDGAIAWECRRCAILFADSLPVDSVLQVVETAVDLRESMTLDDSLIAVCDHIGRQPFAMRVARERAGAKREDEPGPGDYVYVEELPEAITRVPPSYPDAARQEKVQGTVMLQVLVGKDGRVHDAKVVKSIGPLDDAAIAAARQWVFKPALSKGQPVAVWVAVPMKFTLH